MILSGQDRVAATVAYADIFDYPLTPEEVRVWIIGSGVAIVPKRKYITLPGRSRLILLRKERAQVAKEKWCRAKWVASFFHWIPTVMLVGVTGGLSMNNAKRDDDIDLFIITSRDTLWISRLLISIVTQMLGVRRLPNQRHVTDKICLNMFMAENALALATRERDLFLAHEVLQMVPLWERGSVYARFLVANRWVKYFLPMAWEERRKVSSIKYQVSSIQLQMIGVWGLRFLEHPARVIQLWYMSKRRTSEVIESGVLRFHPQDVRSWVRQKYANHLKRLKLPLDKIFYHR